MLIAETFTFTLGRYTVQQRPRFDSPAWAVYIIFRGAKLIGKSFSRPDLDCCKWLERNREPDIPCYADPGAKLRPSAVRGLAKARAFSITSRGNAR